MKISGGLLTTGGIALFLGGITVGRIVGTGADSPPQSSHPNTKSTFDTRLARGRDPFQGEQADTRMNRVGVSYSMKDILAEGDMGSRLELLVAKLERSNTDEFEGMLASIAERGLNSVRHQERLLIISAWARRDPQAAIAFLEENGAHDQMRFAAMESWASVDPDAALEWVRINHGDEKTNEWMVGIIQSFAVTDPLRAGSLIAEVSANNSRERWRAMEATMPYVLEQGSDFAKKWVEQFENGRLQSDGAKWMAGKMAFADPHEAADWIDSLGTKEARREASEVVAARLAQEDLAVAQSWVKSLPEDTRTEAAEGVVAIMAQKDPREAVAWLEQLGDNADYDGAWVDLLQQGFKAEPEVAMVGALRLANEGSRERYTANYLSRWMKEDRAAATQWASDYKEYLPNKVVRRYRKQLKGAKAR